jgi:hypothetical protein
MGFLRRRTVVGIIPDKQWHGRLLFDFPWSDLQISTNLIRLVQYLDAPPTTQALHKLQQEIQLARHLGISEDHSCHQFSHILDLDISQNYQSKDVDNGQMEIGRQSRLRTTQLKVHLLRAGYTQTVKYIYIALCTQFWLLK